MTTVGELVREGRDQLRAVGVEPPGRESSRLLGHLLGLGESQVLSRDVDAVPPEVEREFRALLARRRAGEPMAYLTGEREFYGRSFRVDGRVLIPRPETEHLVELALGSVGAGPARVLDVGTGSGCVAVTLAAERPRWRVLATDLSIAALAVARENALRHGVAARVRLASADLTAGLTRAALGALDLVVGNLPYVEELVVPHLSVDVRDYEPRLALTGGGSDGLGTYRRLLDELSALRAGAVVVLEFGLGQEDAVAGAALADGRFEVTRRGRDLSGIERNVVLTRRG